MITACAAAYWVTVIALVKISQQQTDMETIIRSKEVSRVISGKSIKYSFQIHFVLCVRTYQKFTNCEFCTRMNRLNL